MNARLAVPVAAPAIRVQTFPATMQVHAPQSEQLRSRATNLLWLQGVCMSLLTLMCWSGCCGVSGVSPSSDLPLAATNLVRRLTFVCTGMCVGVGVGVQIEWDERGRWSV